MAVAQGRRLETRVAIGRVHDRSASAHHADVRKIAVVRDGLIVIPVSAHCFRDETFLDRHSGRHAFATQVVAQVDRRINRGADNRRHGLEALLRAEAFERGSLACPRWSRPGSGHARCRSSSRRRVRARPDSLDDLLGAGAPRDHCATLALEAVADHLQRFRRDPAFKIAQSVALEIETADRRARTSRRRNACRPGRPIEVRRTPREDGTATVADQTRIIGSVIESRAPHRHRHDLLCVRPMTASVTSRMAPSIAIAPQSAHMPTCRGPPRSTSASLNIIATLDDDDGKCSQAASSRTGSRVPATARRDRRRDRHRVAGRP